MKLTVNIVTAGRMEVFKQCCRSVAEALPKDAEALVIVNGPCPEAIQFLLRLNHPQFRWVQTPRERLARSRNRALELAHGEILYCLDDDVVVPPFLFSGALQQFEDDPKLAIIGGPNLTPPQSSFLERAFGHVMASWFACPMVRQRYMELKVKRNFGEQDLIFCNLAVRRPALGDLRFAEHLRSNEENLFLYLARRRRLKIQFSPSLYVYHRRRKTIVKFIQQVFSYGIGRAQQTLEEPVSCHPAFLVPSAACLMLLSALVVPRSSLFMGPLLGLYLILSFVAAVSTEQIRKDSLGMAWVMVPITALVHLSYGCGVLWGFVKSVATPIRETALADSSI